MGKCENNIRYQASILYTFNGLKFDLFNFFGWVFRNSIKICFELKYNHTIIENFEVETIKTESKSKSNHNRWDEEKSENHCSISIKLKKDCLSDLLKNHNFYFRRQSKSNHQPSLIFIAFPLKNQSPPQFSSLIIHHSQESSRDESKWWVMRTPHNIL